MYLFYLRQNDDVDHIAIPHVTVGEQRHEHHKDSLCKLLQMCIYDLVDFLSEPPVTGGILMDGPNKRKRKTHIFT